MADIRIRITVDGTPKPKGSLKHVGRGRLVEQVKGSGTWRDRIAGAALQQHRGAPLVGAVVVEFEVRIALPKSAPKRRVIQPVTRSSGDIDKHARNVLDALKDGGVIGDDSQVVELRRSRKRYCLPGEAPGAVIEVFLDEVTA
jgi:Holliday junction resolvase RusA-like endonuclease